MSLLSLSPELLIKIFQCLPDAYSVVQLGATCHRLGDIAGDDTIWKPLVMRTYPAVAKHYLGPDIREGWEDFVELFGHLKDREGWQHEYFLTWRDAYRAETFWLTGLTERLMYWSPEKEDDQTWRDFFKEEIIYQRLCAEICPSKERYPWETWVWLFRMMGEDRLPLSDYENNEEVEYIEYSSDEESDVEEELELILSDLAETCRYSSHRIVG